MHSTIDYCYDDMNLYSTPDQFIIHPNDKDITLIIRRKTSEVSLVYGLESQQVLNSIGDKNSVKRVCGILGKIRLIEGYYLLVATHRIYVGMINDAVIWRLVGYDILPFHTTSNVTSRRKKQNEHFLKMLRKTLETPHLYFSYSYPLTQSLERAQSIPLQKRENLLASSDQRFVWNGALLNNFNNKEMHPFLLPLILGFVAINEVEMNGQTFNWTIISRRSVDKAGTRFYSRGINDQGKVANFVETEQIIEFNGHSISFLQIRGSMPFYWHQLPNLRLKPSPELENGKNHMDACQLHFGELTEKYGKVVAINLVDHKGAEGKLETKYRDLLQEMDNKNVRYESYDFHHECRKMRWERLSNLVQRLQQELTDFGVFHLAEGKNVVTRQTGIFRTKSMERLEPGCGVRSLLARESLRTSLERLSILHPGQTIQSASPQFETLVKGIWADNADFISLQYSGTGALKTDFTRTGKRTGKGVVNDGLNTLTRYYLNNFSDGFKQDAIDLFVGHFVVTDGTLDVLEIKRPWPYYTFPPMLLFAMIMLYVSSVASTRYTTENMLFMLFWTALVGVSVSGIFHYFHVFIDWPRFFRFFHFRH